MFKTFDTITPLTAADVNNYLMKQVVIVCTSGTRPVAPVKGMTIFQTDTDSFHVWSGTAWEQFSTMIPLRGRGRFVNVPTGSSGGEQAIYRIDGIPMKANRTHLITVTGLQIECTGTNNDYLVRWRMTDNGTIPSPSSAEIGSARGRVFNSGAGNGVNVTWTTTFVTGAGDITFGGLITLQRVSGANTLTISPPAGGLNVLIQDIGYAIPTSGITF